MAEIRGGKSITASKKESAVKKKVAPKKSVAKKSAEPTKSDEVVEKILIALDGSEASQKAVTYIEHLSAIMKNCEITLFHVLPTIPPDMLEDGGSEDPDIERDLKQVRDGEIDEWESKLIEFTKKAFDGAKKKLTSSGIPATRIKTKMIARSPDIARDIVNFAKTSGITTIVVGRRGVSVITELALGSISSRVVKLAKNCAVWIIN